MANDDDLSTSISSIKQLSQSHKHRILTHNQPRGKNLINDVHSNEHSTTKLPSLLSKSSFFPSTSETMRFKRYRSQQKDIIKTSSLSKFERQTTNLISQTRLPTLNNNEQKRISEFQRRQIYGLNHLMRELEQEQFREFCKLNGMGVGNSEEIISNNENSNEQSST
ncbi:unnamed protein product [Rotaria sordida]|uniref:Small vasohibin-binding protein n=1 Tax=Rotaria sordida TaxID=392033 RepID=A0A814PHP0_9BILA|nr:unnamed protein product [Rotaria sordida]CAF1103244.1 unnamed protein product [Rotaria sordida]CAF1104195.1 unnamed protein product [Rotaria sordida]CAF1355854.1 unnamed protein product [Rotaria sordida]CAF3776510.1 unnamed protein product [Rotaria sordida]